MKFALAALLLVTLANALGQGAFTRVGSLEYRKGDKSITGDVVISMTSYEGDFRLKFTDREGKMLALVRTDGRVGEIRGALFNTSWSGRVGAAPEGLRVWLALRALFASQVWTRTVRKKHGEETFAFLFRGSIHGSHETWQYFEPPPRR
jgi:hypothetical protein